MCMTLPFDPSFSATPNSSSAVSTAILPGPCVRSSKTSPRARSGDLRRGEFGARPALLDRAGYFVRRLLRQRGDRFFPRPRLADTRAHPRPVHRVQEPHQRIARSESNKLIHALEYFGLDTIGAHYKSR